jgi:hypothetical protein
MGGGMGDADMKSFMKNLAPPGGAVPPVPAPASQQLTRVANGLPAPACVTVQDIKNDISNIVEGVKIMVTSLTVDQIKRADLKVSDFEIELCIPSGASSAMCSLLVASCDKKKFKFDVDKTVAKMSKKKFQIEITSRQLVTG